MSPPATAYQSAKKYLEDMHGAKQLDDLSLAWELFLIFHQRTWNKCEAHFAGKPFWLPLRAKYARYRKVDDVLVYVHQARHVDEHGIQPIAKEQLGATTVSGGVLTGGSRIVGGGHYVLGPGSTATVEVAPTDVLANPVTNRGETYNPPVIDGNPSPPVLRIAEEAIKFFDALFAEVDAAGGA